jgi:methyl-accepting chemotaxis protein
MSIRLKYFIIGALFGLCFPVGAFIFEINRLSAPFSMESIRYIHSQNLVLYMIDTAPLFLGIFALLGGISKEKSVILITKLKDVARTLSVNTELLDRQTESTKLKVSEKVDTLTRNYQSVDHLNRSTYNDVGKTITSSHKISLEVTGMKDSLKEISGIISTVRTYNLEVRSFMTSYLDRIEKMHDYFNFLNDFNREIELLAINSAIEANKYGKDAKAFLVFSRNIRDLVKETKSRNCEILELTENKSSESKRLNELIEAESRSIDSLNSLSKKVDASTSSFSEAINQFTQVLQEATSNLDKQYSMSSGFIETLKDLRVVNNNVMLRLKEIVKKQIDLVNKMNNASLDKAQ